MFHMIWPTLTVGLSLVLVIFEILWLTTDDEDYYRHARFWTRIFVLNFAIGVATGLVMEFQFGTNWERFSKATGGFFGDILGFEGTLAFMLEAGFLGIMVFGWKRVPRGAHLLATILVAFGASLSTFWILVANSWMQTPTGGYFEGGTFFVTDYLKAIWNPNAPLSTLHMWLACLETTAFVVGGISAWYMLRKRHTEFFAKSFRLALIMAIIVTPLQIVVGDLQAKMLEREQPEKVAAMEGHWETNPEGEGADFALLAWPSQEKARNTWELTVPDGLSLMYHFDRTSQITGLKEFPRENWPPVAITFFSFRTMVVIGIFLMLVMLLTVFFWIRRELKPPAIERHTGLLKLWLWSFPLAYIAVEAGWLTREVGRQPWVIYHYLRTEDAFSTLPAAAVGASLGAIVVVYAILLVVFFKMAIRIIRQGPDFESAVPDMQLPHRTKSGGEKNEAAQRSGTST
jgi:cytochrome d ubiquinol oxidase subunit I